MNEYREDNRCYFHPREVVVGVCALCLHERLVILAEKQGQHKSSKNHRTHGSISLQKVFALGSLLNRLDVRHQKSDDYNSRTASSTSQEDSFISINFEDNGIASWEKSTVPKISLDHIGDMSWNHMSKCNKIKQENQGLKSVMEHTKPRSSLRWRKKIGHLFQLVRWKRSSKGSSVCHVGSKLEGVKVRHGWIRTLTKRRTKE